MDNQQFFATAALGMESLLAAELAQLGADRIIAERAGVSFFGTPATAYRACLWSRVASRVLLPLAEFAAADADQLYTAVAAIDWAQHLGAEQSLAVDCATAKSAISHSHFAALRVKDAIVDQFRERDGGRPNVSMERPDLRLNLYIYRDRAILSLDLSGDSLHRRGYRIDGVQAPLKENLAAAILLRAGWPELVARGGALVDPLCGSGTLPVEAALLATDSAPGLLRSYFGFLGWRQHQPQLWESLLQEARQRQSTGRARSLGPIIGYDADRRAIKAAWAHAEKAGLGQFIHFEKRALAEFVLPAGAQSGLLVANPPYGERLGQQRDLPRLYNLLGEKMATACRGWTAAVITSEPQLGRAIGLRAEKINTLYNGALKCQLLHFVVDDNNHWRSLDQGAGRAIKKPLSPGAEMLANRLGKNLKKFKKWAQREQIDCYRLYDADLPEYAVAVDLYGDEVHLQEYRAPKGIDPHKAALRLREVEEVLPHVLELKPNTVHLKVRQPQKGNNQYQRQQQRGIFKEVQEGNCRFLVNLTDYLDTGLFLDHRPTRQLIRKLASGARFLNLFAYTGAATVQALVGGARQTTSVDMSRTYLDWAQRNLRLNGFDPAGEELIQADCLVWLEEVGDSRAGGYDLIFLDPPTFSNSKSMEGTFDIQRDHVDLINKTLRLLAPGGTLIFSNNLRHFKMAVDAFSRMEIEDISSQTIPLDFQRNPRIHNCRLIRKD